MTTFKLGPFSYFRWALSLFNFPGGPIFIFQVGPGSWKFCDRNMDDVKDGYVSCQPFQDTRKWGLVRKMLRTKMSYILANRLRKRRSSYYLLGQVILNRNSKALKAVIKKLGQSVLALRT